VEHRRVSRTEASSTVRLRADSQQPLVLERYRLLRQLGAGAFGVVWLAHDERLDRDVAVKAITGERVAGGRGQREARAAARLQHPAIVTLYEAGAEGETTYLVSELVRGGTLAELLAEGALSDRDVAEIGMALCQALAHAHANGVVHRDVKPSNVLVPEAPHAGGPVAKLTDFGVAHVAGGELLTRTGDVVGTLAYMAPEQAEGREAGAPADLYAAALVLYESFSGVNPIRGASAAATARRLGATLPSLRRQRRDLPVELSDAIDRALLPDSRDRGTVANLHRGLRRAVRELGDEPGTVEAPRIERVATAVTEVAERTRRGWGRRTREQELAEVAAELGAEDDAWTVADRRAARARGGAGPLADAIAPDGGRGAPVARDAFPYEERAPGRRRAPLLRGHLAPGLAAGGLAVLALETLAPGRPPASPLLAGALVALVVGLLPRLGWLASVALLLGWLLGEPSRQGVALVIAAGLLAVPLLLPLSGRSWSLPLAAPLLGIAMLAGAYPALAGQARWLWQRAALGALGFWMLALAEPLAHTTLYYGRARGTQPTGAWEDSAKAALDHALTPLLSSGALAGAALWAAGAAVLPWLLRGRSAALDLVAATVWAAGLAAAAGAIGRALGGRVPSADPRGAALGAAAAVLLAVSAQAVRGNRRPLRAGAVGRAGRAGADPRALP
jgi:hypothetical protein